MSTLTWHLLRWSLLLQFREVRSPKCCAGIAAGGCCRCRTDWTSACASGWLSPPSRGEAWRCTSYYSRSSRLAQTRHKEKTRGHWTDLDMISESCGKRQTLSKNEYLLILTSMIYYGLLTTWSPLEICLFLCLTLPPTSFSFPELLMIKQVAQL